MYLTKGIYGQIAEMRLQTESQLRLISSLGLKCIREELFALPSRRSAAERCHLCLKMLLQRDVPGWQEHGRGFGACLEGGIPALNRISAESPATGDNKWS